MLQLIKMKTKESIKVSALTERIIGTISFYSQRREELV